MREEEYKEMRSTGAARADSSILEAIGDIRKVETLRFARTPARRLRHSLDGIDMPQKILELLPESIAREHILLPLVLTARSSRAAPPVRHLLVPSETDDAARRPGRGNSSASASFSAPETFKTCTSWRRLQCLPTGRVRRNL
jgi:hypothetical protein